MGPARPEIVGVVVVTLPGGGGLMGIGPCGSRPPAVLHLRPRPDGLREWVDAQTRHYPEEEIAFPLWWNGKLVERGWDQVRRILWTETDPRDRRPDWSFFDPDLVFVIRAARALVEIRWADRVALLVRNEFGRLVELEDQAEVTP